MPPPAQSLAPVQSRGRPARLHGQPLAQAAAAQARPLLALATDIAAHLVTDPAHAWAVALHGCGQLARAANGAIGEAPAPPDHPRHCRRGPSRARGDRRRGHGRCRLHRPGEQPPTGGEHRFGHRRCGPGRHPAHSNPDRGRRTSARAARRRAAHRVRPGAVHEHRSGPAGWAATQRFTGRRPRPPARTFPWAVVR
jgi:hypothetical protein